MRPPRPRRVLFSLDGGGVVTDAPLVRTAEPELWPVRVRVHVTEDPRQDLTIYVEDGALHVVGQYGEVVARIEALNHVAVHPVGAP